MKAGCKRASTSQLVVLSIFLTQAEIICNFFLKDFLPIKCLKPSDVVRS